MLIVRCKGCGIELKSSPKLQACKCVNKMTLIDETVTAVDLSKVVIVSGVNKKKQEGLTSKDLEWQEQRSKRKIKKLNFEVR